MIAVISRIESYDIFMGGVNVTRPACYAFSM
jgi:hypothetical protein